MRMLLKNCKGELIMARITYTQIGDYSLPNLILPDRKEQIFGKYTLLRKRYLKNYNKAIFTNLLTSCMLNDHLNEIEKTAQARMEIIVKQMAEKQNVTEKLKEEN